MTGWFQEARRRGVFRVAAVYVIAAWLVMQVADVFFPAWDIPDAALRSLLAAAVVGFPIALVFGWLYDLTADGIKRTPPADADELARPHPLRSGDYVTLAGLVVATGLIVYTLAGDIAHKQEVGDVDTAASLAPPNSIAVLPFANISDDQANDYFCDGISEEILHRLGEYRDMHVMARTSSFAFKGTDKGPDRLAEILGVRYLLQGSVRKSEGNLRISASLVDAQGYQLWNETFDRRLTSVFAIQSEIAESVVSRLAETLLDSYVGSAPYEPDIDAYQAFLVGREYLHNRSPGYQESALENFDRAIAIDPEYPEAHAGRAIALTLSNDARFATDQEKTDRVLRQARESVDTALALNSDLAIGRAALGLWLDVAEKDFAAAEMELRAAVEDDPTNANASNWLIRVVDILGRFDEAIAMREAALKKDPLNPILSVNLANHYSNAGDFYRAEGLLLRLLDLPTPPGVAMGTLHNIYEAYGRYVEAAEIAKKTAVAYSSSRSRYGSLGYLAVSYAHLGMWDEAFELQAYIESALPGQLFQLLRRGFLYRYQGDYEAMGELLAELSADPAFNPHRLPTTPKMIIGIMHAEVGDRSLGLELLESVFEPGLGQRDVTIIDVFQGYAAVLREEGDSERADEIFAMIADLIQTEQDNGLGRSPAVLFVIAQNHAVAGNRSAAIYGLEKAIDAGWRDYYWVINDTTRWGSYVGDPRFDALMERVREDVERQRRQVEEIELTDGFRERLTARN